MGYHQRWLGEEGSKRDLLLEYHTRPGSASYTRMRLSLEETGRFQPDGGGSQGESSATLPKPRGRLRRVPSSRFRRIVLRLVDWSHLLVAAVFALLVFETMDIVGPEVVRSTERTKWRRGWMGCCVLFPSINLELRTVAVVSIEMLCMVKGEP